MHCADRTSDSNRFVGPLKRAFPQKNIPIPNSRLLGEHQYPLEPIRDGAKARRKHEKRCQRCLLVAQAKAADQGAVALDIILGEVGQQLFALANQHEKPAAGMMIFLVRLEMLRQIVDSFCENGNLNFRRSCVRRVRLELLNEFLFLFQVITNRKIDQLINIGDNRQIFLF